MIRRRNNVGKQGRVKIREPERDYSETEAYLRSKRRGYETRKPEKYHSEYNYNTFDDEYNGWEDIYKPRYSKDEYSAYDTEYDSDDDVSYRYNSTYYDYYFDTPKYSSYYNRYDSAYNEEGSDSECRTCHKHGKRGGGRIFDDSSSLYRYEEDHPKYRHRSHSYKEKKKTNTPGEIKHTRLGNDLDIYAIRNILGQKGFKYRNRYSTTEPTLTSEVVSETEIDSRGYKGHIQKRKGKPEYHVYTTQTNAAPVFYQKTKSRYPEKLISVTDYEETPMLALKDKNKRGYRLNDESDIVYLPVVMKSKYNKGKASEQNVNNLKSNRKDITIYTVSNKPSNVFRKAHANSYNLKKIESKTNNGFTNQTVITGSPFVYTASEVGYDNIMSLVTNQNICKSGLRKSNAQPIYQSGMNERNSLSVGQQRVVSGLKNMDTKNKNSQLKKSLVKRSIAVPKNTRVSKTNANDLQYLDGNLQYLGTSTTDLDTEGQYRQQSVLKQSTADPRSQNIEGRRKSLEFEQKSLISNLQNANFPSENGQDNFASMNNILIQSQSSIEGIKSIVSPQHNINTMQNVQIYQSTMPKSILRQVTHTPENQRQVVRDQSLASPEQNFDSGVGQTNQSYVYVGQEMEKEKQNIHQNIAKQNSVARTGGYVDSDQLMGIEGENVQKSNVRQGSIAQRGQSFVGNEQVIGIEGHSKQKSIAGNSVLPERGQNIQENDDVLGIEIPSFQKSMVRQSVAQRGQSFVDRDHLIVTEEDKTKRSTARLSKALQRHPSYISKDDIMGTEGQSARRSMARNISMTQKDQSLVGRNQTMGTEMNNTQKSITRQSSVARRGQSFGDSAQITETGNIQRSMIGHSVLPERGQSIVDRGEVMGTEGQSIQKSMARQSSVAQRKQSIGGQNTQNSMARQSSVAQRKQSIGGQNTQNSMARQSSVAQRKQSIGGQNTQKSMAKQSSVVRRGQSFVDNDQTGMDQVNIQKSMTGQSIFPEKRQSIVARGEEMGTDGQTNKKSMARQSSVAQRNQSIGGQNAQISMAKQSSVEQRGQSFMDRTQMVGTENKSTPKSMVRHSSVAQRDQTFLGGGKSSFDKCEPVSGLQETETLNQQPQVSVFRPSTAYKYGQQENSAVRQQSLNINEQGEVTDIPQSGVEPDTTEKHGKLSSISKRLSKSKSKSLLKKALNKLSAFQGQSEKGNHPDSTAPILDVILNEANVESRIEYQHQSPFPQESTESFKQPVVSKKSKKSTKSKLKSLLWKPKKSRSKQRTLPNSENAQHMTTYQSTDEQQPSEFYQTSDQYATEGFSPTSEGTFDLPDADLTSENQEPKESTDHFRDFFETTLKGYDLTPIIYFLHIAQLIVGVTMFDKLMEIFEVF